MIRYRCSNYYSAGLPAVKKLKKDRRKKTAKSFLCLCRDFIF